MTLFPRDSPFNQQPSRAIPLPQRETVQVGATYRTDVVEVPIETLESWYSILDDLRSRSPLRTSAILEELIDLRDEIYRYLR
jgi:hypothetical protein